MIICCSGSHTCKTAFRAGFVLLAALCLFADERAVAAGRELLTSTIDASPLRSELPQPQHSAQRLKREVSASSTSETAAVASTGDGAAAAHGDASAGSGDGAVGGGSQGAHAPAAGVGSDSAIAAEDHTVHDAPAADASSSSSGAAATSATASSSDGDGAHHDAPPSDSDGASTADAPSIKDAGSHVPASTGTSDGDLISGDHNSHQQNPDTSIDVSGGGKVEAVVTLSPPMLAQPSWPPRSDEPPKPTAPVGKTVFYSKTFDQENRCLYCNGEVCRGIDRTMPSVCFTTGPCWVSKKFEAYGDFVRVTNQSLGCSPTLRPPDGFDCRSGTATACTLTGNTCLCCCNGDLCNGDDYCDRLLASSTGAPTAVPSQLMQRLWFGSCGGVTLAAAAALLVAAVFSPH